MQVRPFTWLALSFFGYYCAYGVFLPLFPAWLKTQSYSEESIGLLLACAYIFRFSGGILFSGLIKRVSLLVNGLRYLGVALFANTAAILAHNSVNTIHKIHTAIFGIPPIAKCETAPVKAVNVMMNTLVPTAVLSS